MTQSKTEKMDFGKDVDKFMKDFVTRNPHMPLLHQAAREIVEAVYPDFIETPEFARWDVLRRMLEPEEVFQFSINWMDSQGIPRMNRGYRVHFGKKTGPCQGGLRFDPDLTIDTVTFLALKQRFKNVLTGHMMDGAKGGADFDPKKYPEVDIMRFCQAFAICLSSFIGPEIDGAAGDIGVGQQEVSYMFGMNTKLTGKFNGSFTGKGTEYGGSILRVEATGYGLIYFVIKMLEEIGKNIVGKKIAISGAGNAAQGAAKKAMEEGGIVVTLSDKAGTIYDKSGLTPEKLEFVMSIKNTKSEQRGTLKAYAERFGVPFFAGRQGPWQLEPFDIALPCSHQNELDGEDARTLVENGVICVAEGGNMSSTPEAIREFEKAKVPFGVGTAVNAGGVTTSLFEKSQDSSLMYWNEQQVDRALRNTMAHIHTQCVQYGKRDDYINYALGAYRASFRRIAEAMVAQGVV